MVSCTYSESPDSWDKYAIVERVKELKSELWALSLTNYVTMKKNKSANLDEYDFPHL